MIGAKLKSALAAPAGIYLRGASSIVTVRELQIFLLTMILNAKIK
jgi:hypothetical protein